MSQWPLPKRQDFIRQLQDRKPQYDKQLEFQGELRVFGVHVVDIELPCYRLSNGRTRSAQQELVATENLPDDFFIADPDSAPALEKQHEILRKMVTTGTDAEILSILRKNQQTDPLILDPDGYVINGNRRLCAMRLLIEEDAEGFERFRHVQVVFLPPCTPDDIDELEAKLQWLPDGRAEYSWVDKAMMLRERRNRGWSEDKLCRLYEMSRNDIRKSIAMLEDAEAYLEQRGRHGEYSRVLRKEFAFDKLQKGRSQCADDEAKKQFFTSVAYLMLDDPDATGRRLYDSIPDALKFAEDVAGQLRRDFADSVPTPFNDQNQDGLEVLGGDCDSDFKDVAEVVGSPEHFDKAREVIRDKLEEMRTRARERRDATYCLREIQKAYTALENARGNLTRDSETQGIVAQLDNIEAACKELRSMLNNGND
jgi:biotin operon repressor